MTEALDKAEAALERYDTITNAGGYGAGDHTRLAAALRALVAEHRRLLAELDEAHAHFQVQEARIREARQVDDAMVERAARAMYEDLYGAGDWEHREVLEESVYRQRARAALRAAPTPDGQEGI